MTGSNGVSDVLWLKALLGPSTHTRVGLPSMSSLVFYEEGALAEGSATLITLIGLLSRVDPLVLNEWSKLAEGFATLVTLIGLLPSVDPLVFGQG